MAAVKSGRCNIQYDTPFVYAEVNADVIHWELSPDRRTMKKLKVETRR